MGLREEKKRQTRKAISDMATELFVKHGYHAVTTAEIAERAGVSVPTLFNYFATKEALVFDEDAATEEWLVSVVVDRPKGQSIHAALLAAGLLHIDEIREEHRKNFAAFVKLVDETPELSSYSKQMWMRYEKALATAIKKQSRGTSALEAEAVARFALDAYHRVLGTTNPKSALKTLFALLEKGWSA